jgi:hypothetical protein
MSFKPSCCCVRQPIGPTSRNIFSSISNTLQSRTRHGVRTFLQYTSVATTDVADGRSPRYSGPTPRSASVDVTGAVCDRHNVAPAGLTEAGPRISLPGSAGRTELSKGGTNLTRVACTLVTWAGVVAAGPRDAIGSGLPGLAPEFWHATPAPSCWTMSPDDKCGEFFSTVPSPPWGLSIGCQQRERLRRRGKHGITTNRRSHFIRFF